MTGKNNKTKNPNVLALFLCERVIRDEENRCISTINILNNIKLREIPYTFPQLACYALLVGGYGEINAQICIEGTVKGETVAKLPQKSPIKLVFSSRRDEHELKGYFYDLEIKKVGTYRLELLLDGKPVQGRNFKIETM